MGLIGKLFGGSDESTDAADRCNECGMTGGRHTDWCPDVAERGETADGEVSARAGREEETGSSGT